MTGLNTPKSGGNTFNAEEAYLKIQALNSFLRLCKSKREVDSILKLIPDLTEYVRLPNGNETKTEEQKA